MSYTVKVLPSGQQFSVAEGETLLAAAQRHSIALPFNCRNGECGACKGRLLAGEVGYAGGLPPGLSRAEQQQGLALFCQAMPFSDLVIEAREVSALQDIPVLTLPCRVARMERLAHDVMALFLKLPAAQPLLFRAGQYVDILLKDGQSRGFSIANAPHDNEFLELHVRNVEGGAFTNHVFEEMQAKALLRIRGPLGSFFLREDSTRPVILLGGGTGFAPLKGVIEHAFHIGFEPAMHLYWGARARRDLYQDSLPRQWTTQHAQFQYTPVLSDPQPEDAWAGRQGFVHQAVIEDYPDLSGHDVYMSGPPAMIGAARELFLRHGLPEAQLFFDSFEFSPPTKQVVSTP
ncbi:MAG: CDP-6-deoxy-delta-3,4-glucoseen reductase [Gammaproteobacteria bacterium]